MPVIFISYRRDDSQDVVGRIYDRLLGRFDKKQVFKDVDSIPLGVSFPTHLQQMVEKTGIILVIIGPRWVTAADVQGQRRLDDPHDFVRAEVEAGLRANIPVIPVLVSNAVMPLAGELPGSMQKLILRNGIKVRPDPDFNNDMERLFAGIDQLGKLWLKPKSGSPAEKLPSDRSASAGVEKTVVETSNRKVDEPEQSICEKPFIAAHGPVPIAALSPVSGHNESHKPVLLALAIGLVTVLAAVVLAVTFWPKGAATAPKEKGPVFISPGPKEDSNRFTNSLGMEFALVPSGKAWLGGGYAQLGTKEVIIDQDFFLGVYPVTREEWHEIMGRNPSAFSLLQLPKEITEDELKRFPVESVKWEEAKVFVKVVNEKLMKDSKEAGWEYRLPTEEQWEYACRGGPMDGQAKSPFDFYFEKPTNDLTKEQANFAESGLKRPCKVGSYPPNQLGLCDMHGNVAQWCEDETSPGFHVTRGSGWEYEREYCKANYRYQVQSSERASYLGFRLARVPSAK